MEFRIPERYNINTDKMIILFKALGDKNLQKFFRAF
jgi:hypothetical protein